MKKIRLSTVSQVYEAFLHSRKALGAKEVTLRIRLPFAPAPTPGTSQAAVPAGCAYRS